VFEVYNEAYDIVIEHNTVIHQGPMHACQFGPFPGFVFRNNIIQRSYGFLGEGTGEGIPTLNAYYPGWVFEGNVIPGGTLSRYPANNFYPATLDDVGLDPGCDYNMLQPALR
jgi:hypothetical protein